MREHVANRPPDFPHRTSWHELVVRRELYRAAEDGADHFAWTTGEQQAGRGMKLESAAPLYDRMIGKAIEQEAKMAGLSKGVRKIDIGSPLEAETITHADSTQTVWEPRSQQLHSIPLSPADRRRILRSGILKFAAVPAAGGVTLPKTKQPTKPNGKPDVRTDALAEIEAFLADPKASREQKREARIQKGRLMGGQRSVAAERLERLTEPISITGE